MIVASPFLIRLFQPQQTKYCHFERNYAGVLPRQECLNLKVVSKDINKINFSQFTALNNSTYVCSDKLEDMPDCNLDKMFFSIYPLNILCPETLRGGPQCDMDGYLCYEINIRYWNNNTDIQQQYEQKIAQYVFDDKNKLRQTLIECEG